MNDNELHRHRPGTQATPELTRDDAEEWLGNAKDVWNHPVVSDRNNANAYEVADLLAEFANAKLHQRQRMMDLLERAAYLVGNPATNISSSTDLACESWQKDYLDWKSRHAPNPTPPDPPDVSRGWIDESTKPATPDCVAVMVDNFKYPTIGWYNKKLEEWVLEDRDAKGKVLKWFPLPNYH